ncbi:phosphatidylglycerol:prolipoprotein diacylglycerol transferase [Candidatus Kinetoplastibacterium crithidii (ex Angomonas deanei ATCC 30255)]|nr:prolipoprotein diacylglyceryl transferase [Candidatus Kinetoplastibacterium crithidii]AFZ82859.1 phosphatidylglycerol:prolipoprotein diacylglycerol transferase [Candidatus Kinetoplastibacterium crithidii (ex Angomonas deanei ATCC 30255)]
MIIEQPIYINPIALSIGNFHIYWYGIMYLIGLMLIYMVSLKNISRSEYTKITKKHLEEILYWGMMSAILGGRLGYAIFYKADYFYDHLLELFYIRNGGMSFHGGLIGVIIFMYYYTKNKKILFWEISDLIAQAVPLALSTGRIGNFINGELFGTPTSLPWGIIFLNAHDNIYRHPSQLYECVLEGPVLFIIIKIFLHKKRLLGQTSAIFLIFYGILRCIGEVWREPDYIITIYSSTYSMGQILSMLMIINGFILYYVLSKKNRIILFF